MMIRRLIYIFIIPLVLLQVNSCETTEKIDDFPLRPAKLVVNCYFTVDSIWEFQLSKSLSVLDNAPLKYIDNAKIYLFHDNNIIDSITQPDNDGIYRSTAGTPVSGGKYAI
ncbi:MAG TPA: hypothetical protein VJ951_11745, partial [Bacteroidales bacterium]|nr:hypothetical protein [Bacteroidales bacterium]